MTIRKALTRDAKKLAKLESELFSYENFPLSISSIYYHIRHSLFYVSEIKGDIVGYILVLTRRKSPKIYSLGVSAAFRKQGVSTALIQHVLMLLSKEGFKSLSLEVRTDNKNAIALYERMKFVEVSKISGFYRDKCDASVMMLKL